MTNESIRILYIDDEKANLTNFQLLFQDDYSVTYALSAIEGLELIRSNKYHIVITDQRMPEMSGIDFLAYVKSESPDSIRILLTAYTETQDIIDAINIGNVYHYITKPFDEHQLRDVLSKASETWLLRDSNQQLIQQLKEKNEEHETLNEELIKINAELLLSKEQAEENVKLKTAFLQNISHEIRTPMNAIVGFSSLLGESGFATTQQKHFFSIIQKSSHQLLSIVNDILTISSIETNQIKINTVKININRLLSELHEIFISQAQSKEIEFITKKDLDDESAVILTDETKLTQILTNLITNAFKFTHHGSIEIGYTMKLKDLTESELLFYVKDTGIGINDEHKEIIFERFRQADFSINLKYGGTGLGLSISKAFVELLQGEIWVESEEGIGSCFYFTIPYVPANIVPKESSSIKKSDKVITVLVAEDEENNFLLINALLSSMNVTVIRAVNGEEAIEISKNNAAISLVLMDIKMPKLDGYSAAIQIKKTRPDLYIIAQSAYALDHEKEKFKGNAFDDYITKPIKKTEFYQKINKTLL